MSEKNPDAVDQIMAIAADPAVWDPTDDAWLMQNRRKRRERARTVAHAIRSALEAKGYRISKEPS